MQASKFWEVVIVYSYTDDIELSLYVSIGVKALGKAIWGLHFLGFLGIRNFEEWTGT